MHMATSWHQPRIPKHQTSTSGHTRERLCRDSGSHLKVLFQCLTNQTCFDYQFTRVSMFYSAIATDLGIFQPYSPCRPIREDALSKFRMPGILSRNVLSACWSLDECRVSNLLTWIWEGSSSRTIALGQGFRRSSTARYI
jgi:hypothetical protein